MSGFPCKDCASGALHGGTPTGRVETLHGLPTYIAEPAGAPKGIVVILADAFGWELVNNRVLADSYAKKGGFRVLLPDFFNGQWIPHDLLYTMETAMSPAQSITARLPSGLRSFASFVPFLFYNRWSVTGPRVASYFTSLRNTTPSSVKIGAAGFCWGGKWTFGLCSPASPFAKKYGLCKTDGSPLVDAGYTAHPSMLTLPADAEGVTEPLSVANGTLDMALPEEKGKEAGRVLEAQNETAEKRYEWVSYEGAKHGFAVRGNPDNKVETEQGVQAEDQAIAWFGKWLA